MRRKWSDGSRRQLEGKIDSFIKGLSTIAIAKREWRLYLVELDRKREEERRCIAEAQERRQCVKERREALLRDAMSWRESQNLRAYIRTVEEMATSPADGGIDPDMVPWIRWATSVADELDPLERTVAST